MADAESSPDTAGKRKVDAFVFDCVCHVFNFDKANALGPPGELFDEHLYAFHQLLTREGEKVLSREEFFKERSVMHSSPGRWQCENRWCAWRGRDRRPGSVPPADPSRCRGRSRP